MTNPTSNFGWQMPTSTDLVTDLPADFEVFGQAVDTDFVDLLGGTTGQVLSKTSATDLDFTWVTANPGDITGVTAGTGITGGGTSGTVTVTNDMATTITAAGDIVVGTGSGTYDNLPIGTTAQVLTADTTVSPYKVKWATPATSGFSGAYVSRSTTQSITSATATAISFDNEFFDVGGYHDNVNPTRFTVPTTGKYMFHFHVGMSGTTGRLISDLRKNGSAFGYWEFGNNTGFNGFAANGIVSCTAADYIEFFIYQSSGSTQNTDSGNLSVQADITFLGA
jgi:hypothetical protein